MEDVCNSLHSVISQPQRWHGKQGPISAAGGGAEQYFSSSCVVSWMQTAEENDSDSQCQLNGCVLHIFCAVSKRTKEKKARCIITIQYWLPQKMAAYCHWLFC